MSTTRSQYDIDLEHLRSNLLEVGSKVDSMLDRAITALIQQDVPLAEEVIASDDEVDALDLQIEQASTNLLALQQPMARDLRLIGTAMKAITDLERIGDHSVDIAKVARKLANEQRTIALLDIPAMAGAVRKMLDNALQAFVQHDLELVEKVVADDDDIDTRFHVVRDELHQVMKKDANLVVQASYLLFVAHYLERVADHCVNIAERVYYVETGKLVQLAKSHAASS